MRKLLLALLLSAVPALAQLQVSGPKVTITQGGNDATVDATGRLAVSLNAVGGTTVSGANVVDAGNTAFRVNCVTGCAGGFTDNTAFTAGTTTGSNAFGAFNDAITNLTSGNAGILRSTNDRTLYVSLAALGRTAATTVDTSNAAVSAVT